MDWEAVQRHLGPPKMEPERRQEIKDKLRELFEEGLLVAGTTRHTIINGKRVGCILGQATEHGWEELFWGRVPEVAVGVNNFACLDREVPVNAQGIPANCANRNIGEPLVTVEPLLRLVDML